MTGPNIAIDASDLWGLCESLAQDLEWCMDRLRLVGVSDKSILSDLSLRVFREIRDMRKAESVAMDVSRLAMEIASEPDADKVLDMRNAVAELLDAADAYTHKYTPDDPSLAEVFFTESGGGSCPNPP